MQKVENKILLQFTNGNGEIFYFIFFFFFFFFVIFKTVEW